MNFSYVADPKTVDRDKFHLSPRGRIGGGCRIHRISFFHFCFICPEITFMSACDI